MPNIVIHACKTITCSGPQIWLCLFTFRPTASKQLNGPHPLCVQDAPGSIPGSGKGFYVWFLVLLLLCFYFFIQKHSIYRKILHSFYKFNLFSILNVLQDLWPIIRVKRYRPSIFNSECFHMIYCFKKIFFNIPRHDRMSKYCSMKMVKMNTNFC